MTIIITDLFDPEAPVLECEQAGDHHGGRDGGQHAAQQGGPEPGQTQQPVGHQAHHTHLNKAGNKGQPEQFSTLGQAKPGIGNAIIYFFNPCCGAGIFFLVEPEPIFKSGSRLLGSTQKM